MEMPESSWDELMSIAQRASERVKLIDEIYQHSELVVRRATLSPARAEVVKRLAAELDTRRAKG